VSAKAPGGGSVDIGGQAGPFNMNNMAETPFSGTVTIKHLDVASTGLIDPQSGIAGVLDFSGSIASNGSTVSTKGKAAVANLRLMPDASTSRVPVAIEYESAYNTRTEAGTLKKADISIGKAVAHLTGDSRTSGATSAVRM